MTQRELVAKAGLTQSYLSKLERTDRDVGLGALLGLQRAFEFGSLEDLLAPPGPPPLAPSAMILARHPHER